MSTVTKPSDQARVNLLFDCLMCGFIGFFLSGALLAAAFHFLGVPINLVSGVIFAIVTAVCTIGSVFIGWVMECETRRRASATPSGDSMMGSTTPSNPVKSDDFAWTRRGDTIEGKYASFFIVMQQDDKNSWRPLVHWNVSYGGKPLRRDTSTDFDTALRQALYTVNKRIEADSRVEEFFQSLAGDAASGNRLDDEEPTLSRGPEVMRRYLGDGE